MNRHDDRGAASRLTRYAAFIEQRYRSDLVRTGECQAFLSDHLRQQLRRGHFHDVVVVGMGCSAIVGDMVRAYCHEVCTSIDVHVLNDYNQRHFVSYSTLHRASTLIIVSTYSGHSAEPMRFLQSMPPDAYPRIVVRTSDEGFVDRAVSRGMSAVRWQLTAPDREYPLFHAPQYFTILLTLFAQLGLLDQAECPDFAALRARLDETFGREEHETARLIAERSVEANILMVGSPFWHEGLFRLAKMHFNEIAMAPATRNTTLEFGHSEIATLSDPERRHSVVLIDDVADDDYTRGRVDAIVKLLTNPSAANEQVAVTIVRPSGADLLVRYFVALEIVQRAALQLGRAYSTRSRDLISESTGNTWYHSDSIRAERAAAI